MLKTNSIKNVSSCDLDIIGDLCTSITGIDLSNSSSSDLSTTTVGYGESIVGAHSPSTTTSNSSGGGNTSTNEIDDFTNNGFVSCVRINGRKVFGPPPDWCGAAPPGAACELYIKRIPIDIDENEILEHLQRIGPIYEFRLMVNYNCQNRGYGFVRFIHEADAMRALDLLNHTYIRPNRMLSAVRSYDKCRLFIGNIPKDMPYERLKADLKEMFSDDLTDIVLYPGEMTLNRGFAFLDFIDHAAAVRAKKMTSTGRCFLWGRDVKIVWANPQPQMDPVRLPTVCAAILFEFFFL